MQLSWTVFCPQRWIEQQDDMFCFVSVRLHPEVCEEEGQNAFKQQQQKAEEEEKEGTVALCRSGSTLRCAKKRDRTRSSNSSKEQKSKRRKAVLCTCRVLL
jgi:hypothetical protein